jgi:hypothetical protein
MYILKTKKDSQRSLTIETPFVSVLWKNEAVVKYNLTLSRRGFLAENIFVFFQKIVFIMVCKKLRVKKSQHSHSLRHVSALNSLRKIWSHKFPKGMYASIKDGRSCE